MEANQGAWVLAELVGGPRNGSIVEIGLDGMNRELQELGRPTTPGGGWYAPAKTGIEVEDRPALPVTDEQAAIARLGRGSPEFCVRLVWVEPHQGAASDVHRPQEPEDRPGDLLHSLLTGDEDTARTIAWRTHEFGSGSVELFDAHLAPALREIGRRWELGQLGVYHEHRATGIVQRIMADIPVSPNPVKRGRAVTAVLSGDQHSLPSEAAAHALRDDGWRVEQLGPNTPPNALLSDLDQADADVIVLSPTMEANRTLSHRTAMALIERGFSVLVGTPGSTLAELQRRAAG